MSEWTAWRQGPRLVLVAFCALVLVAALFHTGHSAESLDVRTYVQMIRGVVDHGLPYWDNGPIDRFPMLVVAHGTPAQGHVWGIYSPLYPYLVAPIFKVGGLERVSTFTFALQAPLALVTFLLAKRVVKNEWYATCAAILTIVSTPILGKSLELTPFTLVVLLATVGTYYAVRLIELPTAESRQLRGVALLCGIGWSLANAAHVLSFPMAIGTFVVIAIAPDAATGKRSIAVATARLPLVLAGFACTTFPVSYLNHLRFDSWNPISYGRPPFSGPVGMSVVDQLRWSLPAALFVAVACGVGWAVRKRRLWWVGVAVGAVLVAAFVPTLRERFVRYAALAIGYIVDVSFIDLGPPYRMSADGLGQYLDQWVAKATLQSTPLLILAPLALVRAEAKRWSLIAMLVPAVALYTSFVTRANMPYVHAFGWPWVYMRYTLAALPALLGMSMVVVERLRPTKWVALAAIALGGTLCAALATSGDHLVQKRVALLILPLAFGLAAFVLALRHQGRGVPSRAARALMGIAAGFGIAIALGHDFRAQYEGKRACDYWVDQFAKVMPHRFALVGQLGKFDVLLSSTATHDVRYVSTHVLRNFGELRPVIEVWRAESRPIFLHWHEEPHAPWADVTFTRVAGMPDVYEFHFATPQ